jgi:hypothetical protein
LHLLSAAFAAAAIVLGTMIVAYDPETGSPRIPVATKTYGVAALILLLASVAGRRSERAPTAQS